MDLWQLDPIADDSVGDALYTMPATITARAMSGPWENDPLERPKADTSIGKRIAMQMDEYTDSLGNFKEGPVEGISRRLPFIRAIPEIADIAKVKGAADRLREGGTDDADVDTVARYMARQQASERMSIPQRILDTVLQIPGFAIEFAATSGGYNVTKEATTRGLKKLAGKGLESAVGKVVQATIPRAVGVAAQTAMNVPQVAISTAQQAAPELKRIVDSDGKTVDVELGPDRDFLDALPAGFLDAMIEIGSERSGKVLEPLKLGIVSRWMSKEPGRTAQAFQAVLKKAGWNGAIGEVFEERVGDVARMATGLEEPGENVTGQLATGQWKPALEQLLVEGAAFAVPGAIANTAGAVERLVSRQGEAQAPQATEPPQGSVPGATDATITTPPSVVAPTAEPPPPAAETPQWAPTPETAAEFVSTNPTAAQLLADKVATGEPISRKMWRDAGLPVGIVGKDRSAFGVMVRDVLRAPPPSPVAQPPSEVPVQAPGTAEPTPGAVEQPAPPVAEPARDGAGETTVNPPVQTGETTVTPEEKPREELPAPTPAVAPPVPFAAGDRVRWVDRNGKAQFGTVSRIDGDGTVNVTYEDVYAAGGVPIIGKTYGPASLFTPAPREAPKSTEPSVTPTTADVPATTPVVQPEETGPTTQADNRQPDDRLSVRVAEHFEAGGSLTSDDFFRLADESYGGTRAEGKYGPSDAYDALETGVNRYLRGKTDPTVDAAAAKQQIKQLEQIIPRVPSQTNRSGEKDLLQQFSTPPAYAYAAAWIANIAPSDVVIEPSAGVGGIAVHAKNAGATVHGNELSQRRAALLKTLGLDGVTTFDAEQIHNILPGRGVRPTVAVMNPPFSHAGQRMGLKKVLGTDLKHVGVALDLIQPGGRVVAIVGAPLHGEETQTFKNWFSDVSARYNVRANVTLERGVYKGYGTTFPTRVLVIDKPLHDPVTGITVVAESPGARKQREDENRRNGLDPETGRPVTITGQAASLADLIDKLEGVRNERQATAGAAPQIAATTGGGGTARPERAPAEPSGEGGAPETQGGSRPAPPVRAPTGDRGATESPGGDADAGGLPTVRPPSSGATSGAGASGSAGPVVRPGSGGREPARERGGSQPGSGESSGSPVAESSGEGPSAGPTAESGGVSSPPTDESPSPDTVAVENRRRESSAASPSATLSDNLFESYRPSKLHTPGAKPHPGSIVESAAMAAVESPDVTYSPTLPRIVIEKGLLSEIQIESVVYAGQAHENTLPPDKEGVERRQGYMIGDGTGVGKGREIAGVILDNWMKGRRRAVWVTKNPKLLPSAKRDWKGIGQDENQVVNFGKTKLGQPVKLDTGIMFTTYGQLRQKPKANQPGKSRVEQLVEWLGEDFDGVIAFDEAHEMSGAVPGVGGRGQKKASQQGLAGLELQKRLPKARVVYVSATAATEVTQLAYADRLGLWGAGTQFSNVADFVSKITDAGVAAMELVARDMKALGRYLARSISFNDGTPEGTVEFERLEHTLTPEQRDVYDKLAEAWQVTLNNFDEALGVTGASGNSQAVSAARSAFWGAHQRFFNQVITSMQLPSVLDAIESDLKAGHSVVIQLTNTGEAAQERSLAQREEGDDLADFDSSPADVLIQMVDNSFPTTQYEDYIDANGNVQSRPAYTGGYVNGQPVGDPVQNAEAVEKKNKLLDDLSSIAVPNSPIDSVLDRFGHETVAEITGRDRRVILMDDERGGRVKTENKRTKGFSNEAEVSAFQDGRKRVLIFSEAGGTGMSYHADRTTKNQEKRRHYLLQAGWKAAAAVQGLGRTHRTNQRQAPEYILVHTDLKGQKRFLSTIARRLAQLGALTKGQRQAGSTGIFSARDNLEGTEAQDALRTFFRDMLAGKVDAVSAPEFEKQTGLKLRDRTGRALEDLPPIRQFLNRLLSLKVDLQNRVFDEFDQRLQAKIARAEADGTLDVGVENLSADRVEKVSETVAYVEPTTGAKTKHVKLRLHDRNKPLSFDASRTHHPLFYVRTKNGKVYAVETSEATRTDDKTGGVHSQYRLRSPSGRPPTNIDTDKIHNRENYEVLKGGEAEAAWNKAIENLPEFHTSETHMITGIVLPIWNRLRGQSRVMRTITDEGEHLLGRIVPPTQIKQVLDALGVDESGEFTRPNLTPQQIVDAIDNGSVVGLENGWRIKSSRVQGEHRIEVIGPNFTNHDELETAGVFREKVGFKLRYFIPANQKATDVIEAVTGTRPVIQITGGRGEQAMAAGSAQHAGSGKGTRFSPGSPAIPTSMADTAGEDQSAQEIVATMSRLFGVPIRTGRINLRKALGIYKLKPQVVRLMTQSSADLAVATHEVAHHLDRTTTVRRRNPAVTKDMKDELARLDYEPQKGRQFEGFAEFIRLYLTTDEAETAAPKFYHYFTNNWLPAHKDTQSAFDRVKSMIDRFRQQGAAKRVRAARSKSGFAEEPNRTWREWLADVIPQVRRRLLRGWIREDAIVAEVDREANRRGYAPQPGELTPSEIAAANRFAGPSMAIDAAENGVRLVTTGERIGKGLKEHLADIKPEEFEEFVDFLHARHALEVYDRKPNMNPGISKPDAEHVANAVNADAAKRDRYTDAAEGVTKFNRDLLRMITDAGVVTANEAAAMRKAWRTYVPLLRAQPKRRGLGATGRMAGFDVGRPIHGRRGSGQQIINPIDATLEYATRFYQAALDKKARLALVKELDPQLGGVDGMGKWLERVPPKRQKTAVKMSEAWAAVKQAMALAGVEDAMMDEADSMDDMFAFGQFNIWRANYHSEPGKRIERFIIDGRPVLYEFQEDLHEAVTQQPPAQLHWFLRIFTEFAKSLRLGATGLNPGFALKNAINDWFAFQHRTRNSRSAESLYSPFREIAMYVRSELSRRGLMPGEADEVVELWKRAGGKLATRLGMDRPGLQQGRRKLLGQGRTLRERLILPVDTLVGVINVTEVGPRLAEFAGVLRKHGYTRQKGKIVDASGNVAEVPQYVLEEAINAANDVTTNFGQMGRTGRVANQFIPFLNAGIQGTVAWADTFASAARGAAKAATGKPLEGRERDWQRVAVASAITAAGTVAYWLARGDDDDYVAEEPWLRGYYTFVDSRGKPVVRIPKGREYGRVSNFVEAVLNAAREGSAKPLREALEQELAASVPGSGPALVTPLIEVFANYDTFRGKPIENQAMQDLRPGSRAQPYNTELVKAIGNYLNVSPAKIEHVLDRVTGGGFSTLYGTTEKMATGKAGAPDTPLVGGFMIRRDYVQAIDDYYAEAERLTQEYNTAVRDGKASDEVTNRHRQFEEFRELMTAMRKSIAGETDRDARFEVEKYIAGLARYAMGERQLDRYPNPLVEKRLPKAVQGARDEYVNRLKKRMREGAPKRRLGEPKAKFEERKDDHRLLRQRTGKLLGELREAG